MFERLRSAVSLLKEAAVLADRKTLDGDDAAQLVELFTTVERIAAAGRMSAARRVASTKAWQKYGHRTAAEWVAAKTGSSRGAAVEMLETAARLESLPETRDAFRKGLVSEAQAHAIGDAASADPAAEGRLLRAAPVQTIGALREECRRVRAAAVPDELAAYEAIRRRRYLRYWSEPGGAVRLDARLTPDDGAEMIAAIDERRDRIFAQARRDGRREASQAYAADALVELARGSDRAGPRAMVHVLVDQAAFASGRAGPNDRCEIPGIGRIPAATARALAGDGIVKTLLTKGTKIEAVEHRGRTIPARLRTALEVRDPVCVVPSCDNRKGLEIDHYRIAFADGGPTRMDNLARICRWHHHLKTHCGFRLSGGPGAWVWESPSDLEGMREAARPPPDPL